MLIYKINFSLNKMPTKYTEGLAYVWKGNRGYTLTYNGFGFMMAACEKKSNGSINILHNSLKNCKTPTGDRFAKDLIITMEEEYYKYWGK